MGHEWTMFSSGDVVVDSWDPIDRLMDVGDKVG